MKILLKRRFLLIALVVTILAATIVGTVLAATAVTVPGEVNVVAATYDIQVYLDAGCTIPLASVVWASDLPQGGQRTRTVYVKNVGNMDASVVATLQSAPSGVTLDNNPVVVPRGTSSAFDLTLTANPSAQLGSSTSAFTIVFTSSPPTQ